MLQAARDLAPAPAASAMQSARIHIERLANQWGVTPGTMPTLVEVGEVSVRGGTIARMRQIIDGLPVWGRELRVLVRPDGSLATASGTLLGTLTPRAARAVRTRRSRCDRERGRSHLWRSHRSSRRSRAGEARVVPARRSLDRGVGRRGVHERSPTRRRRRRVSHGHRRRRRPRARATTASSPTPRSTTACSPRRPARSIRSTDRSSTSRRTRPARRTARFRAYVPSALVTVDGLNAAPAIRGSPPDATETRRQQRRGVRGLQRARRSRRSATSARPTTRRGTFDRIYDTDARADGVDRASRWPAITSLFYVINWLHDFWYDAGFTEAAGNAQNVELRARRRRSRRDPRRGAGQRARRLAQQREHVDARRRHVAAHAGVPVGRQGDAHADDVAVGRTPADRRRVVRPEELQHHGRRSIARRSTAPAPNADDGCTRAARTRSPARSSLVDRGNCTFKTKALNAQNAGGIGMIIANNVAGTAPPALGDDATITTADHDPVALGHRRPTARSSRPTSQPAPSPRRSRATVGVELDGTLDSTLIAHEFGHYLHHRLSLCGNHDVRRDERGLGRFHARCSLLARPGDNLDGAFPFGVYSTQSFSADPAYFGIRRAPYSVEPDDQRAVVPPHGGRRAAADDASVPGIGNELRGPQRR